MSPSCPVCGSGVSTRYGSFTDEEYFTSAVRFDYWHCGGCGSLFLHPLPVDRLAEIYPPNYYSYAGTGASVTGWIKNRLDARRFRACLRRMPGRNLSVLDVGGSCGWTLDLIRAIDARVVRTEIVDLDPRAGDEARARGHAYSCVRIEKFKSSRTFDLILLLNLIEHVESPRRVLAQLAERLSPDGLILVKTPNYRSLDARLFAKSFWAGLHVPRHWTVFTRPSFEMLLQGSGLAIDDFAYTQGGAFWAASLLAAWHRRGWVRISRDRPAVYHPLFPVLAGITAAFDFLRLPFAPTSQMFITLRRERR